MLTFGLWIVVAALGQTPPTSQYKPTEIQQLKLENRRKDAVIAKQQLDMAQANFNQALSALQTEGAEVKKENKWPDTVAFDPDKLTFSVPEKK